MALFSSQSGIAGKPQLHTPLCKSKQNTNTALPYLPEQAILRIHKSCKVFYPQHTQRTVPLREIIELLEAWVDPLFPTPDVDGYLALAGRRMKCCCEDINCRAGTACQVFQIGNDSGIACQRGREWPLPRTRAFIPPARMRITGETVVKGEVDDSRMRMEKRHERVRSTRDVAEDQRG
ncbi:hypothetical protein FA95DRAFT_204745 [Auriscalpium vulgare]|uniref:Uncharacterized protein n=1 Tax=Auriscalpium vulgare TaxID=40419 RepID=A0ACB8RLA0_9AGAM|nr:hypothetical protein FA95DRAFT_204745 [Auriscalpium vulgare]